MMPVFGMYDKEGNLAVNFNMIAGIPNIPQGAPVCVTIKSKEKIIEISKRFAKEASITLNLSQIVNVQKQTIKGNYDSQKTLNRAAIGGYMFGPIGALVGGSTTGTGTRTKTNIIIAYRPSNGEDIKGIVLEIYAATNNPERFMEELKKAANII
jgi:hypothetical protein